MDYETIKSRLFVKLVNAEKNEGILKKCPFLRICDLAFIYCMSAEHVQMLNFNTEEMPPVMFSTLVTNEKFQSWGITFEQLHEDAIANTKISRPEQIMKMGPMTVVCGTGGAASLFYPGMLDSLYESMGPIYCLPSSIHEFIIVKDDLGSPDEVSAIVRAVNNEAVRPEEWLSDTAYHFDGSVFELAEKWFERVNN